MTNVASCSYAVNRCSTPASTKTASPTFTGTCSPRDVEDAVAVEHDVHLVVVVGLLPVGLRRDEHIDAELEARGLVHDLVAASRCAELLDHGRHAELVHSGRLSRPHVTASAGHRRLVGSGRA